MLREISVKRSASLNSRISEYHGHRILFDADQRVLSFMCLQNNRVNEQNDFFTMAFLFCTNPWLQTRTSRKVCHKQIDRFHENALDVTSRNEIKRDLAKRTNFHYKTFIPIYSSNWGILHNLIKRHTPWTVVVLKTVNFAEISVFLVNVF